MYLSLELIVASLTALTLFYTIIVKFIVSPTMRGVEIESKLQQLSENYIEIKTQFNSEKEKNDKIAKDLIILTASVKATHERLDEIKISQKEVSDILHKFILKEN